MEGAGMVWEFSCRNFWKFSKESFRFTIKNSALSRDFIFCNLLSYDYTRRVILLKQFYDLNSLKILYIFHTHTHTKSLILRMQGSALCSQTGHNVKISDFFPFHILPLPISYFHWSNTQQNNNRIQFFFSPNLLLLYLSPNEKARRNIRGGTDLFGEISGTHYQAVCVIN